MALELVTHQPRVFQRNDDVKFYDDAGIHILTLRPHPTDANLLQVVNPSGALKSIQSANAVVTGAIQHQGTNIQFYNSALATKQAITYSRTGEPASAAGLRAALVAAGLITDNTIA